MGIDTDMETILDGYFLRITRIIRNSYKSSVTKTTKVKKDKYINDIYEIRMGVECNHKFSMITLSMNAKSTTPSIITLKLGALTFGDEIQPVIHLEYDLADPASSDKIIKKIHDIIGVVKAIEKASTKIR